MYLEHELASLNNIHLAEHSDGLCHRLTRACQKPMPVTWDMSRQTKDQWENFSAVFTISRKTRSRPVRRSVER